MTDTLPPLPPNLQNLTGGPFLGIFLDGYLYGILTLQYYNYYSDFQNDVRWLRNLVHIQFILETAQTVMTLADGFHWFVYGYGDLRKLGQYFLANFDSPMLCSIIALISQGVYCWRIYHLSGWKIVTSIIALIACVQAVGGFGIGIANQRLGSIDRWDNRFSVFIIVGTGSLSEGISVLNERKMWSLCSAIADSMIAGIMTYLLLVSNPFGSTRQRTPLVKRLTRLIIETNAASALVAIALFFMSVIGPIAPPKTSFFLCPGYVLGKLYSNSFITMLNNRRRSGGSGGPEDSTSSNRNDGVSLPQWNSATVRQLKDIVVPNMSISVHTETSVCLDGGDPAVEQSCDSTVKGPNSL